MRRFQKVYYYRWLGLLVMWLACNGIDDTVNYNTDVKPILNKKCLRCHGGVRQNGGFSLLTREQALVTTESGKTAIIPGNAHQSEMIKRLLSDDPELRMPLDGDPLTKEEIDILKKWIDQGLSWDLHWSYRPIQEVKPPTGLLLGAVGDKGKMHAIDLFVGRGLQNLGISKQSPKADKATLVRRVSMDLIGMPPPESLKNDFLLSQDERSFAILIDSLLALPQFGERWTSMWLDLARYADSKGYERDPHRNMWRYRDWVIRAFNQDMPYDQFIIEQIAGDMLPHPTDDQLLATGFHRNTSTNDEGGSDNEEYRTYAVLDRVNTTWEALMGTTFGCVQCHSHPYDPFLHKEYYQFLAFFNNSRDADTAPDYPLLRHFETNDSVKFAHFMEWTSKKIEPEEAEHIRLFIKTWQPAWHSIETDSFENAALYDTKNLGLRQNGNCRMAQVDLSDKKDLYVRYRTALSNGRWEVRVGAKNGPVLISHSLANTNNKWKIINLPIETTNFGIEDLYFTYYNPTLRDDDDKLRVSFDWFHFNRIHLAWDQPEGEDYQKELMYLLNARTTGTPIMRENPSDMQRKSNRFERGNWMVKAEIVQPSVPKIFEPIPEGVKPDRLALAKWLANEENPLVARAWVNRIWAQLFGRGLVETLEDLGSQGAPPSHPELLDWMAWRMIHEHQWSLKRFLKEVVMSATYQQQSYANDQLLELDPYNIYLSRGPRVRLSAEQIRDQALSVSGLINHEMYGLSVMPYQPVQWTIPYSSERWKTSTDGQQYRRGVYTYWKRSSPYPAMMIYDAAAREVCSSRRIQTNTPLHALVTLNDPVYMEAAAHFAKYMYKGGSSLRERLQAGYQKTLGHSMPEREFAVFERLFKETKQAFVQGDSDPKQLLIYLSEESNEDLAGLVIVANAMMNLDAFIMKN